MAISVIKDGNRTKIVGKETYPNGMTLEFREGDGSKYNKGLRHYNGPRILDMRHARGWLAGEGHCAKQDGGTRWADDGRPTGRA